jgi:hypothetical protein
MVKIENNDWISCKVKQNDESSIQGERQSSNYKHLLARFSMMQQKRESRKNFS